MVKNLPRGFDNSFEISLGANELRMRAIALWPSRNVMLRKLLPENWHTSCSFFALHSLEHSAPIMSALRFDRSRIFDSKFETMSTRH